jgi:hypothetical protein
MPMKLDEGWNQIQFNLSDFTRRAYGTNYIETVRVQIHANCRIRRIYFSDRLYSEEELPPEFKLFLPVVKRESDQATIQAHSELKNDPGLEENVDEGVERNNEGSPSSTVPVI